ncbi:MAG: hypothetical protein DI533_06120 [Cereibacter sphaeroides]|uniref:DUF3618 domain-containing protein n=1 Tax=Cereibacter sphaeroides TaxID=1063 RepID=A0A2W5U9Y8_CERSP|nr:MAG: hypothetical protein DI533_06120 [Cereibacter sphaeroides]
MSESTEYLEREIETHRANVEDTLERLKDRLSVNNVVDQIGQFVGVDDVPAALAGAGQKVRENPVALGLIGLGVAWLLLGGSKEEPELRRAKPARRSAHAPSEMYGRVGDEAEAHGVAERVGEAAHHLRDKAGHLAEGAREAAGHAAGRVRSAAAAARPYAQPVSAQISRHPLLISAVALVAGAVIGSALPRTRAEDRVLSRSRDRLLDEAKAAAMDVKDRAVGAARDARDRAVDTARDVKDRAVGAAQEVYAAAHDTAEEEGLIPYPVGKLGDKLGKVAKSAIDEAKEQIEPVVKAAKDELETHTGRKNRH